MVIGGRIVGEKLMDEQTCMRAQPTCSLADEYFQKCGNQTGSLSTVDWWSHCRRHCYVGGERAIDGNKTPARSLAHDTKTGCIVKTTF